MMMMSVKVWEVLGLIQVAAAEHAEVALFVCPPDSNCMYRYLSKRKQKENKRKY